MIDAFLILVFILSYAMVLDIWWWNLRRIN